MQQSVAVVTNRAGGTYRVIVTFDGPGNTAQQRRAMRERAYTDDFCEFKELDLDTLRKKLQEQHMRVFIGSVALEPSTDMEKVPRAMRQFLFRDRPTVPQRRIATTSRAFGFFAISTKQPCVLAYICVTADAQRLGLGSLLLNQFEILAAETYDCRYAYLQAVESAEPFYRRKGYARFDAAASSADGTELIVEDSKRLENEEGLILMRKQLQEPEAAGPAFSAVHSLEPDDAVQDVANPIYIDLTYDSDDETIDVSSDSGDDTIIDLISDSDSDTIDEYMLDACHGATLSDSE